MMKRAVKAVRPDVPIFGIDTAELEALRQLEKVVGMYLNGDWTSHDELDSAYRHLQRIKRVKRSN